MSVELDVDLAARSKLELERSQVFALRDLSVEQCGESLVIQGRVSRFYHKQLAQEVVRSVSEGVRVVNSVEVLISGF